MVFTIDEVRRISDHGRYSTENKRGMKDFLTMPRKIYKGNSNWIEPPYFDEAKIFEKRYSFWEHAKIVCYVAYENGNLVGRIAAIHDDNFNKHHNRRDNELGLNGKTGFFGFFESIDDKMVSSQLFGIVERELKYGGDETIIGPMEPTMNRKSGMLVKGNEANEGFNGFKSPPRLYMPYNPEYYDDILTRQGYHKAKDLLAFNVDVLKLNGVEKRFDKLAERFTREKTSQGKHKVRIRSMNGFLRPGNKKDIRIIGELYNSSWVDNWGFTPLTEREINEFGEEISIYGGPNWVYIAEVFNEKKKEYEAGGFMGAMPDINPAFKGQGGKVTINAAFNFLKIRFKPKYLRVALMGVKPELRAMGLDGLLLGKIVSQAHKKGIIAGEQSWMLEDNVNMLNPLIRRLDAKHYKTYRLYQKSISD